MNECGVKGHSYYRNEVIDAKYRGTGQAWGRTEIGKVLANNDALTDIPIVLFVDELLAAYPDAKVVLTNRDVDDWVVSMSKTVYEIFRWWSWNLLSPFDPKGFAALIRCIRNAVLVWTGEDFENRAKLRQGFLDHYTHVRAVVPNENLLEFRLQDGWDPLYEFLGEDVSAGPFPHINDAKDLIKLFRSLLWLLLLIAFMMTAKYAGELLWWLVRSGVIERNILVDPSDFSGDRRRFEDRQGRVGSRLDH